MTSSKPASSSYRRRLIVLATVIIVAVAAYTAMWFWLAGQLTGAVARATADARAAGQEITCERPEARGYPFRLGLFCDAVAVRLPREGIVAGAGALRSAAQIYAPDHIVTEIDGPAILETHDLVPLQLDWEQLRASLRHDNGKPQRISTESRKLVVALRNAGEDNAPFAAVEAGESHARINDAALDLAATLDGVTLSDPRYAAIPALGLVLDATIPDGASFVDGTAEGGLTIRGHDIDVKILTLAMPSKQASVALSGHLSIGRDGLIDGTVDVRMANPLAFTEAASVAFPESQNDIAPIANGLAALAVTGAPVTLTIRRSRVSAGFIPLGALPPI